MFDIENGVAMPVKAAKYPVDQLEVGQSFFVPLAESTSKTLPALKNSLQSAIGTVKRRDGNGAMNFTKRGYDGKALPGAVAGVRVWREADTVGGKVTPKKKAPTAKIVPIKAKAKAKAKSAPATVKA